MRALNIKLAKSFSKALLNYQKYKTTTKVNETLHLLSKIDKITKELIKIANQKKHLSTIVQYGNSKGLQYFVVEQHAVFFKITKTQLQVKYFVAVKRIKKPLGISK